MLPLIGVTGVSAGCGIYTAIGVGVGGASVGVDSAVRAVDVLGGVDMLSSVGILVDVGNPNIITIEIIMATAYRYCERLLFMLLLL